MTQKTISLPENIYFKLKRKKKKNETFPDLINRLLNEEEVREKKHKIMDLAGAFGEESEEWEKIEQDLYDARLQPSSRKTINFEEIEGN
ncbi:MAG: antitoxin VapB family protein [Promethearchaeota archaeon]